MEDKEWDAYFDPFCSAFFTDSVTVELEGYVRGGRVIILLINISACSLFSFLQQEFLDPFCLM